METLPINILLIEDDDCDAHLVARALSACSLSNDLTRVRTVKDGLRRLTTFHFDVVLTDLGLPDSLGFESVEQTRAVSSTAKVIVLSGRDDVEARNESVERGAHGFLYKYEISADTFSRLLDSCMPIGSTNQKA